MTKDFIVALNYANKYGSYTPSDKKQKIKAYEEFGKDAEKKLRLQGLNYPDGLCGIWWDEVKQFVEKGVIDWSFVNNL